MCQHEDYPCCGCGSCETNQENCCHYCGDPNCFGDCEYDDIIDDEVTEDELYDDLAQREQVMDDYWLEARFDND